MKSLRVNEQLCIPAKDLSWSAARSSGPGGQNVNKVSSKVTLRFDLRGCEALSGTQKARLRELAGKRMDASGGLLISAQAHRSQQQNLERAREGLRRLIAAALRVPKPRRATKPTAGSKRRRLEAKRRQSEKKKGRTSVDRADRG